MKLKTILAGLLVACLLTACHSEPSLQKYYVKHQNNESFLSIDVPMSLVLNDSKTDSISKAGKQAVKQIRKANVLLFPRTENNEKKYQKELRKVKNILQHPNYHKLMTVKSKQGHIKVDYLGDKKSIDEFVILAYDKDKGFVVARLLGRKMDAKSLYYLIKEAGHGHLNLDFIGSQLDSIK